MELGLNYHLKITVVKSLELALVHCSCSVAVHSFDMHYSLVAENMVAGPREPVGAHIVWVDPLESHVHMTLHPGIIGNPFVSAF